MLRRWVLLVPVVIALAGCSRCGKAGAGKHDLPRLLPADAEAVVYLPDLGSLGQKVALLQRLRLANFAAQLQGAGSAEELASMVATQTGIDFRSPEALRGAGIDPSTGLGVVLRRDGQAYSVLGVSDGAKLEETLTRLARDRLGAAVQQRTAQDGTVALTYARAGKNNKVALGVLLKPPFALLAPGVPAEALIPLADLPRAKSLAEDAGFLAGGRRLPEERDALVHVPRGSTWGQEHSLAGATFTAVVRADAFVIRGDVPWAGEKATLDALAPAKDGAALFGLVPRDAFLVGRFAGDPAVLEPLWPRLVGARGAKAVQEAGVDVKAVLANLRPGQVFSLSLAPDVKLTGGMPSFDVRQTNPFRYLHLLVATEVKDAARAKQTLEQVPALAPRLGAEVTPTDRDGQRLYLTHYAQGEGAHLALKEKTVLLAGPEARLLEALGKVDKASGPPPVDAALAKAFEGKALAAVLDLRRLTDSVKALPSEAWGVGGFAIKATVVRWLEATDDLRALSVTASAKEGAVQAELTLGLAPAPERASP